MALTPAGNAEDMFLVIDMQVDFLPGGSLAVAGGDEIVPLINRLGAGFANVGMTQDWHTPGHISFASAHPGKSPFEMIDLPYGPQVLWPDHCVQGSRGAEFAPGLTLPQAQIIVRKGYHADVDSYSGLQEADRKTRTGLEGYLRERGIRRLFVAGLATDYCVSWTAIDAANAGFEVLVIEDACRAIDNDGSLAKARADMAAAGVMRIGSADLA